MELNRGWTIAAGAALWLPLLFSFVAGLSVARLPGAAIAQVPMIALLVTATLLLGLLIGRAACIERR